VVGTPGRIRDHLGATIDLSKVQTLVLDEADRMTDMGFYDEIAGIVSACPKRRQTLLFSATYPDDIRNATAGFLATRSKCGRSAARRTARSSSASTKSASTTATRRGAPAAPLPPVSTMAFCNTKAHCRELADELRAQGFSALALYGELEQRERDEILVLFANRSCSVLVATDVAARGLDIANLEAVINVDVSKDTEVHIHRIGRTGRGGETGPGPVAVRAERKEMGQADRGIPGPPVEWFDLDEAGRRRLRRRSGADGDAVHPGRQEGQAASRRPAGRADRRRRPGQGTGRQDQRVRIPDLCGARPPRGLRRL
jgi:ATP-independent RNA helicase DbpA